MRHLLPDIVVFVVSLYFSLFLRVGYGEFSQHLASANLYLPLILGIRLLVMISFGSYNIYWRYISALDVLRLARSMAVSTLLVLATSFFIFEKFGHLPRTVYIIDGILALIGMLGSRLIRRIAHERKHGREIKEGKRTLIFGAGDNGRILATHFRTDPGQSTHLLGFIDDNLSKVGLLISNIKVLGTSADLERLITEYQITQVIISPLNVASEKVRTIIQTCRPFNIRPRIMSNTRILDESQKKSVNIDREINLADLLNRQPLNIDVQSVRQMIKGKRVLVTGAGGTIGSELARQVLDHEPARLLLLDHSEFCLYEIDQELRLSTTLTDKVVPLLIDIKDQDSLSLRLKEYVPQVIIHAAAYKHVHLVEANPYSSILNNIWGTLNLLEVSEQLGVENFILISSDKAVNPAGIMGATKRVCEILVTVYGQRLKKNYCSVRFGNVLGSSGSLIPLLKRQIADGGPVTITHADMTRFFMLIPEAVSLVLKAATISKSGDISVLKMGEPVKIVDIAKSLIALSGKSEEEIPIMFTGLRPGEKLYEELYLSGNEITTEHPDVLTIPMGDLGTEDHDDNPKLFFNRVYEMISLCRAGAIDAIYLLNELVKSTYVPPEVVRDESQKITYLINNKH